MSEILEALETIKPRAPRYWWTADYHFSHTNIIQYCNRPFSSVEKMNNTIIQRHNERVAPDDIVFFLGDFMFKGTPEHPRDYRKLERKLNGRFIFVKGNHDNNNSLKTPITKLYANFGGHSICMVHDPRDADPEVSLTFHGHVHTLYRTFKTERGSWLVNVGVDAWDFYPVSFDQIQEELTRHQRILKSSAKGSDKRVQDQLDKLGLNWSKQHVVFDGNNQAQLLYYLGMVAAANTIWESVWDKLDTHICKLRKEEKTITLDELIRELGLQLKEDKKK